MVAWLVRCARKQAGGVRLAIVAQLPGHEVERLGQLPDLVVRDAPAPPG